MSPHPAATAVIWDFDGTLVDSRRKNLNVTRAIVAAATDKDPAQIATLQSVERYDDAVRESTNWRALYASAFGLTPEETDRAGRLWTQYQLSDTTPTAAFAGVAEALRELRATPQGIVSQNARANIIKALDGAGLLLYFDVIIGFEEVPFDKQKPAPDGLLLCLERLTGLAPGPAFYVGDHETDVRCAANANSELRNRGVDVTLTTIGALYGSDHGAWHWPAGPDYRAATPLEIVRIVRSSLTKG